MNLWQFLKENVIPAEDDGVDLVFMRVQVENPTPEKAAELEKLAREHKGEFCQMDPFDGKEHSYIEVGGWIGDQSAALMFMGACEALGLGKVMTPKRVLGADLPTDVERFMAGRGMVTFVRKLQ